MAESLGDLIGLGPTADAAAHEYLASLAELSTQALHSTEPQRLAQASHSLLLSLQDLSKRSHKPIFLSTISHASLRRTLPILSERARELDRIVSCLDQAAESFSSVFGKSAENTIISRRKQALRMLKNAERLVDVMELPPLLASAVKTSPVSFSSTLDLNAHVRRLASLYPSSALISSVLGESDAAIRQVAGDLIAAIKSPGLKLAGGLRTVGWLKRVVPDLVPDASTDDVLPALFVVCRLKTLATTLAALEPLRELADEERLRQANPSSTRSGGQQTERYLKRYIEVFREHAFGIVSMSKGVHVSFGSVSGARSDPIGLPPSALPTFPLHLVNQLLYTLCTYLPTVKDQASRDSIVAQVLYCAGSLGRLGADFGMLLAALGVKEWADLIKRHRLLAGRLESVIGDYRSHLPGVSTASGPST